jgi:signal peptide peptidase SppA
MRADILKRWPRIGARIFNVPIAMEPRRLEAMLEGLLAYASNGSNASATVIVNDGTLKPDATVISATTSKGKPYPIAAGGVAVIDVQGALVHHAGQIDGDCMEISSYERISSEFQAAMADSDVKSILLVIDSPGGEVSGAADLADEIFAARGTKEVVAFAADMACSAAYKIASAASKLYVSQTALVGSIGVVVTHMDVSQAAEKAGLKFTHVHAGARKVDGTPYAPLAGDALSAIQGEINACYSLFCEKVARNRGISAEAVQKTEAGVFVGDQAVKIGLADGVRNVSQILGELATAAQSSNPARATRESLPPKETDMSTKPPTATEVQNALSETEREELAQHRAEKKAGQIAAENERVAKREAVLAKHEKRLKPATMASMKETLDAIKDPAKVDEILGKLPDEVNPKATGKTGSPAPEGGSVLETDPELEMIARAEKLMTEAAAKKSPMSMRGAISQVAAADPALAARVQAQREKSPGPTIRIED